ncbi:MAG: RNA polymerase sigma factor [Myxococcaceae bacterium]
MAPTIARTDTIEHPGSRNLREALQVEERAQSVSSEMHIAVENQDTQRVREALTSISAEQRTALELRYWEGLSPVEIGERTALPLESVNKRLQLALLKLGDLLSED